MKDKIIITDVDDVILAWEYPFHTWMETRGYLSKWNANNTQHDVARTYSLGDEKTMDLVRAFNDSAAIGFLPPLRDAQYYVKLLHEKHQYRFVAVTACAEDEFVKQLRIKNLCKIFGDEVFIDYHILPIGASKEKVLSELAVKYEGCPWIEDTPEHALAGAELGFDSYLMLHGRNKVWKYDHRVTGVANWEEIYNILISG